MKQFFEEPRVTVERFTVTDQTLTATVSWFIDNLFEDSNETTVYGPFNGPAIG